MTPQEAIRVINDKVRWLPTCPDIVREALDMAIEALEKQIPMKPKKIDHWRLCPNCCDDYLVGMKQRDYEDISYCLGCGQAIDWSDGE